MPKNNQNAFFRTLLFLLATVMLLCPAGQAGTRLMKSVQRESTLPSFVKEVISWIVPAP